MVEHGEDAKPGQEQIALWVETFRSYDTAQMKQKVGAMRAKLRKDGGPVKATEMIEAKKQKLKELEDSDCTVLQRQQYSAAIARCELRNSATERTRSLGLGAAAA